MTRVTVLGCGSWGTAFALVCADAGSEVAMWGRDRGLCDSITRDHVNPVYQPGIALPPTISATTRLARALAGADVVAVAVPSAAVRQTVVQALPALPGDAVLVSLAKGLEPGTDLRMTEVLREVTGRAPSGVAVLTGPNLAREIAERQPTAGVVGCVDLEVAALVQQAATTPVFHLHANPDVIGCELGGVMKNVVALAVGMAAALGLGDNARSSLITRGLAEMSRLGAALGADRLTFAGLAGLGDLVATCSSPLSRNRAAGERLVRESAGASSTRRPGSTAEGLGSCVTVLDLARRHGVDVPLTERVVAVVRDGEPPASVFDSLVAVGDEPEFAA